jgi:CheY-like chemotaxis protein
MQTEPIKILLIEDNPGDVILTREAFLEAHIVNSFDVLHDGEEAIQFFDSVSPDALPDIVLLDLNLPKVDGRQVLDYLKNSPKTQAIPVVILTSSEVERDVLTAYQYPIDHYLIKPIKKGQFIDILNHLDNVWMHFVKPIS